MAVQQITRFTCDRCNRAQELTRYEDIELNTYRFQYEHGEDLPYLPLSRVMEICHNCAMDFVHSYWRKGGAE